MKHNKIKYIIKTDKDPTIFQKLIDMVNSGEFENAETNDHGGISRIRINDQYVTNTIIFKDVYILKFVDEAEFVTNYRIINHNTTHCFVSWKHFYIQMEDGLAFTDYGFDGNFYKTNKTDFINYCKYGIIPEWAVSENDYVELDDIVL